MTNLRLYRDVASLKNLRILHDGAGACAPAPWWMGLIRREHKAMTKPQVQQYQSADRAVKAEGLDHAVE